MKKRLSTEPTRPCTNHRKGPAQFRNPPAATHEEAGMTAPLLSADREPTLDAIIAWSRESVKQKPGTSAAPGSASEAGEGIRTPAPLFTKQPLYR